MHPTLDWVSEADWETSSWREASGKQNCKNTSVFLSKKKKKSVKPFAELTQGRLSNNLPSG